MRFFLATLTVAATLAAQTDPRLVFSTYHGGDRNDDAAGVAVAPDGSIYVAGESESRDLNAQPVGGKPLTAAVFKGYITKYSPDGQKIVWRQLIGGSSNTVPRALALDPSGNVYVAGETGARDLPTVNPAQAVHAGLNIAFLMKFAPDGKLLYSTFFGGERNDSARAAAVDSKGAVYIAGRATSTKLPVKDAHQPQISAGGQDAFIAKFNAEGQLEYATYVGGTSGTDDIHSIAVGPDDSLYVAGESMSPNLATGNAWVKQPFGYSSFAARFTPAGALQWLTYIGGRGGYSKAQAIAVDGEGRAWIAGHTTSKQLAVTPNAIQPAFAGGNRDGFLMRIAADGSTADYVSYLGGSYNGGVDPDETAAAIRVDAQGRVLVAGETFSPDFPGRRALQPRHAGAQDAYLVKLDPDNKEIVYATFWGGSKKDVGAALAVGPDERVTLAGESYSEDLTTLNAVQRKLGSSNDAFVAQVCEPRPAAWPHASASFSYTVGGERPAAFETELISGCPQEFPLSEISADQPWLAVTIDKRSLPAKLRLEIAVDGLAPGEHRATVAVVAPDAYRPRLEIPVSVTVIGKPE